MRARLVFVLGVLLAGAIFVTVRNGADVARQMGLIGPMAEESDPVFVPPKQLGGVNDFAHVLADSVIRQLDATIADVRAQTKGEIVVVTIPSLNGTNPSLTSQQIGRSWHVGYEGAADDPHTHTGVIMLLAIDEQLVWVELADGSQKFISKDEAARVAKEVHALSAKGAYDAGARVGVREIAEQFAQRFGVKLLTP